MQDLVKADVMNVGLFLSFVMSVCQLSSKSAQEGKFGGTRIRPDGASRDSGTWGVSASVTDTHVASVLLPHPQLWLHLL